MVVCRTFAAVCLFSRHQYRERKWRMSVETRKTSTGIVAADFSVRKRLIRWSFDLQWFETRLGLVGILSLLFIYCIHYIFVFALPCALRVNLQWKTVCRTIDPTVADSHLQFLQKWGEQFHQSPMCSLLILFETTFWNIQLFVFFDTNLDQMKQKVSSQMVYKECSK